MEILYRHDIIPTSSQVIELYENAGLPRPTHDAARIQAMFENSDLIITAWDNDILVAVSRSITDWVWSCYLADLAVREEYKKKGIGKKLIELTKEKLGDRSMMLLLSVPTAMEYYPRVGMERLENAFILNRSQ